MEIRAIIKKLPTNKSPGPSGLIDELHHTIKDLIPVLFKTKTEEEEMLPNSLTLASIIHTKTRQAQKNKLYRPICLINNKMQHSSIKYYQIKFNNTLKRIIHQDQLGFILGM